MDEMLREILPDFIIETSELLEKLDQGFLTLEQEPDNTEVLNEIFRYAHTIKGSSGIFEFNQMNTLAHRMESVLDRMRKGELQAKDTIIDILLKALDLLKAMLEDVKNDDIKELDVSAVEAELNAVIEGDGLSSDGDRMDGADSEQDGTVGQDASADGVADAGPGDGNMAEADAGNDDDGMDEMMKEILPEFINETSELLEQLDQNFVDLEVRPDDHDLLNEIFRAAHTIKGSSSVFGFGVLSELAHKMENILDKLRKDEMKISADVTDVLLESTDVLKDMLEEVKAEHSLKPRDIVDLISRLQDVCDGKAPEVDAPSESSPSGQSGKSVMQQIRENMAEEAAQAVSGEREDGVEPGDDGEKVPAGTDTDDNPSPEAPAPKRPSKGVFIQEVAPRQQGPAGADRKRTERKDVDSTIRVNISRLDNLMNLAGELILGRNRLIQMSKNLKTRWQADDDIDQLSELSAQINLLTTDIQMAIMKTRMLSIQHIFNKFPRMVRDISRQKGKTINLMISGEETELDKSVLEDINDPLVHIIRNSIDHGIEMPADREAAGKPATGTVKIAAYHEGNHIVIRIEDDGRGIDIDRVIAKAIEKKLILPDDVDKMTPREKVNLIFAPGFSTAEKVSEISGRGVGMDVVKTNIEKMKGTIDITTELGKGTTIYIKIPLTLAIIQALLVKVQMEIYAIPVLSVTEIVQLKTSEIDTVYGQEVIRLRDDVLPIIRLKQLFDIKGEEEHTETEYIVMVALAEQKFGLVVNRIIGEQEVVVKPLGSYLGQTKGLSGASIMGDGRVCLILDIATMYDLIYEQVRKAS